MDMEQVGKRLAEKKKGSSSASPSSLCPCLGNTVQAFHTARAMELALG